MLMIRALQFFQLLVFQFETFLIIAGLVGLLVLNVYVSVGRRHHVVFGIKTSWICFGIHIQAIWSEIGCICQTIFFETIEHQISALSLFMNFIPMRRRYFYSSSRLSRELKVFLSVSFGRSQNDFSLQKLHDFMVGFLEFSLNAIVLLFEFNVFSQELSQFTLFISECFLQLFDFLVILISWLGRQLSRLLLFYCRHVLLRKLSFQLVSLLFSFFF